MTVLVTGANGFVGSRVVAYLRNQGFSVRALVRRPESLGNLTVDKVVVGDITDREAVQRAVAGSTQIVHCAAVPGPDHATALRVNGEGTANLVEAALAAGCERFVLISTQSVYDKSTTGMVPEEAPLCSEGSPYEVGKVAAEQAVRRGEAQGLRAVVLRPPMILGAHPTSTWGYKIAKMLREKRFPLIGDGSNLAVYVHVDNLAQIVQLSLTNPRAVGQTYNTVDGEVSWRSYTDQFRTWMGLDEIPSIEPAKAPPVFAWSGRPDGEKLRRELDYRPQHTYADAMAEIHALLVADGIISPEAP